MSKEKQIEEMAKIITSADPYSICKGQPCLTCKFKDIEKNCYSAKALYNADYRKQSEGEWVMQEYPLARCSVCGVQRNSARQYLWKYCPNCGAKMKGGE